MSHQNFAVKLLYKYKGSMRVDARPFSEICHSTEEVYEVSEVHRWKGCMIEDFHFL